jgi:hypothetical protein
MTSRRIAATVPSVGTMGPWSPPLMPSGGRGGDDDVEGPGEEEPVLADFRRGLTGSSE